MVLSTTIYNDYFSVRSQLEIPNHLVLSVRSRSSGKREGKRDSLRSSCHRCIFPATRSEARFYETAVAVEDRLSTRDGRETTKPLFHTCTATARTIGVHLLLVERTAVYITPRRIAHFPGHERRSSDR